MNFLIAFSRITVGATFIISGLIKANDSLGFSYKLIEYFGERALGLEAMIPYALPIAIFVVIGEILLGAALLLGAFPKLTNVLLMVMILFFGWLTYYTANCDPHSMMEFVNDAGERYTDNPDCVLECGCFGNAIPLTPWESFYKDFALFILILPAFIGAFMNKYKLNDKRDDIVMVTGGLVVSLLFAFLLLDWVFPVLFTMMLMLAGIAVKRRVSAKKELFMALAVLIVCGVFQYYTIHHLPVKDYRPYAIGLSIKDQMKSAEEIGEQPTVYYNVYTLKNLTTGEITEVDSDVYLQKEVWKDKNLEIQKDETKGPYVRIKGYEPAISDFVLENYYGDDLTTEILDDQGFTFLHFAYDLTHSCACVQGDVNAFMEKAMADGHKVYGVTASGHDTSEQFRFDNSVGYEFLVGDEKVLKTVVRANPGFVVLKDGVVINKWHHNDLPDYDKLKSRGFNP